MLASAPFFAFTWETVPQLYTSWLYVCTYKGKNKKPTDKQWKEKMQGAYERGIKQISMIDMAIKETRKQVNKREGKQARKQTKGGVREG